MANCLHLNSLLFRHKLTGCGRLLVLALYGPRGILSLRRYGRAYKLLWRLVCLIHQLLMMQGYIWMGSRVSGRGSDASVIIKSKWLPFFSCHWLRLFLIAIWIECIAVAVAHKGILCWRPWDRDVFRGRVIDRGWRGSHWLLAELFCQLCRIWRMLIVDCRWNFFRTSSSLESLHWLSFLRHLRLVIEIRCLWWRGCRVN